eukprot:CAMPEP_0172449254 /NCGR_PEP_ID=MMETSP1065-20121228/8004_1 /TAXON_ID=265537 /ORGANISM="Amphiprora paludosa, Strain CCMP125" /LENGTH=289 /DNA_ID=CAMNT_0013200881 /DNA_START=208 /DNA_END=1077 /DNA_ORIENTATION=+
MGKGLFYGFAILFVLSVSVVVVLEPIIPLWCDEDAQDKSIEYLNPSYVYYPCRHKRAPHLLFLTPEECDFGRRLVASVFLGSIIGWERRMADRPAGIRTMSLVSLASCLFTICSAFAFLSGPMAWDASRIAAAIPSGVGFLGAGLIFKEAQKDEDTGLQQHVVHGLTTATSVWLSAAVGCACGGALYFVAAFCTAIMLVLLRFGPRQHDLDEDDEEEANGAEGEATDASIWSAKKGPYGTDSLRTRDDFGEKEPMIKKGDSERGIERGESRLSSNTKSLRSRAALGSVV